MQTETARDVASAGTEGDDRESSLWARADEVRAALAQEVARRGWDVSLELFGVAAAPELELLVEAQASSPPRRWRIRVTSAPAVSQVRHLLAELRRSHVGLPVRRASRADRWCAPA